MAHVTFIAQEGTVEEGVAAEGVVVGDTKSVALVVEVKGVEEGGEIVVVEVGIGIKAHDDFIFVVVGEDAVEEEFACPAHAFAFACPALACGTAVDNNNGELGVVAEEVEGCLVVVVAVAAFFVVDTDVEGEILAGLITELLQQRRKVGTFGQHGDGNGKVAVAGHGGLILDHFHCLSIHWDEVYAGGTVAEVVVAL